MLAFFFYFQKPSFQKTFVQERSRISTFRFILHTEQNLHQLHTRFRRTHIFTSRTGSFSTSVTRFYIMLHKSILGQVGRINDNAQPAAFQSPFKLCLIGRTRSNDTKAAAGQPSAPRAALGIAPAPQTSPTRGSEAEPFSIILFTRYI